MYALIAMVVHALLGSAAALAIAPYSLAPGATFGSLWGLSLASAALSTVGLVSTSWYLSRRLRPVSGITVGWLCGLACGVVLALSINADYDYSVILYLALLAPTLLAVLLASLLDKPKSGWQT